MKKLFLSLCVAAAAGFSLAGEMGPGDFLGALRRNVTGNGTTRTYAALEGTVEHLRNDAEPESYPIYFAVLIAPERSTSQVIVDGREGYFIGQNASAGGAAGTAVTPMGKPFSRESLLSRVGVNPTDLSLGFVHYDLVRELAEETVGVTSCRVLLLKDSVTKTHVKVYGAKKYSFVLKAEFLASADPASEVRRQIEIAAFRKSGDLYYVKKLSFSGPGWRSRIVFDKADVGTYEENAAPKIFRKL